MVRPSTKPRRLPPINHPWSDDSDSPLHRIRYPKTPTIADIHGFFDALSPWAKRINSPWAVVFDISHLEPANSTSETREAFAVRGGDLEQVLADYCVAFAAVTPSMMLRGVATAVMWIQRPTWPVELFATTAEAEAWAWAQLDTAPRPDRPR